MQLKDGLASGFDVSTKTKTGQTLLHIAAKKDNENAVSILLKWPGIQVNAENENGFTPIMEACCSGSAKVLRLLLRCKAVDKEASDDDGHTIEELVRKAFMDRYFGIDTRDDMLNMIKKYESGAAEEDVSGRHVLIASNFTYTAPQWADLPGPEEDHKLLVAMFQRNHYVIHEVKNTENVLAWVNAEMKTIDRPKLKMATFVYTGDIDILL